MQCFPVVFCSPELKAQVSFSDCLLFVIRLSVCLWTFPIFVFFSRSTGPISIKDGTKHPSVKEVQFFFFPNEGPCPFPRVDNSEIAKILWQNWKNLLIQNHKANFNQTWHKASLGIWDSNFFKWRTLPFSKGGGGGKKEKRKKK